MSSTLKDQLKACNFPGAVLLRAANGSAKSLIITRSEGFEDEKTKSCINYLSLASKPSIQLLPVDDCVDGPSIADYPMTATARLSELNYLLLEDDHLLDQWTIDQIVETLPAVSELKFIKDDSVSYENLIVLLQHPEWANQLTNLGVFNFGYNEKDTDIPIEQRLVAAINELSALQYLALKWDGGIELPEMPILAQLKVIAIDLYDWRSDFSPGIDAFLRSLEAHAADNIDLHVNLFAKDTISLLNDLSESLCGRIVRYGCHRLDFTEEEVPRLCRQFSMLTSLSVCNVKAFQMWALFAALSKLPQLFHLALELDWTDDKIQLEEDDEPQPELKALSALDLDLSIISHSQVQLLNLPVTMPHLQVIHLENFYCDRCDVDLGQYLCGEYNEDSNPSFLTALECLSDTLLQLHSGVSHGQIILGENEPYQTLEQVLQSANQ